MKRIILWLPLCLFCCSVSGCSEDKKGPMSMKTIEFETYNEAIENIHFMNQYVDEGISLSFDQKINEFSESKIKYCLTGINVTHHYLDKNNKNRSVLRWRTFHINYSESFSIVFNSKISDFDNNETLFDWVLFKDNNGKNQFEPKNGNGFYRVGQECDMCYALTNKLNQVGIYVFFKKLNNFDIFLNYSEAIKTNFMELLDV